MLLDTSIHPNTVIFNYTCLILSNLKFSQLCFLSQHYKTSPKCEEMEAGMTKEVCIFIKYHQQDTSRLFRNLYSQNSHNPYLLVDSPGYGFSEVMGWRG